MEPVLRKDPVKLRRLPNEARSAERKRDQLILANVLKGVSGGAPAAAVAHLPVPSANATRPGKPGLKTAAPKSQPRARAQWPAGRQLRHRRPGPRQPPARQAGRARAPRPRALPPPSARTPPPRPPQPAA
jgi:hypothetical protein